MVYLGHSTESTVRRQFEFRQIMAYIDEFKTFLRTFSDAGATKDGLTALAGRCGEYVKYYQSRTLFSQRQVIKDHLCHSMELVNTFWWPLFRT